MTITAHRNFAPARLSARDRRNAAMHEAGHVVIGRYVGVTEGYAHIIPSSSANPSAEKYWIGQAAHLVTELNRLSAKRRMMIAVGGMVAEAWWSDRGEEFDPGWVDVLWGADCMSPSDWAMTGCTPGEPSRKLIRVVEEVGELLRPYQGPLWAQLNITARGLMHATRFCEGRHG